MLEWWTDTNDTVPEAESALKPLRESDTESNPSLYKKVLITAATKNNSIPIKSFPEKNQIKLTPFRAQTGPSVNARQSQFLMWETCSRVTQQKTHKTLICFNNVESLDREARMETFCFFCFVCCKQRGLSHTPPHNF